MPYCDTRTAVKGDHRRELAVPLYCRRWSCDECAPARKRQLQALGRSGRPNIFLTLTCRAGDPAGRPARARLMVDAWQKIARAAVAEAKRDPRRRPTPAGPEPCNGWPRDAAGRVPNQVRLEGDRLPYLAVVETTQAGEPHLHILCRADWIDWRWLLAQYQALTGWSRVDVRKVRDVNGVAKYVSKYIAKAPTRFAGCKRYWRSQNYAEAAPAKAENEWSGFRWEIIDKTWQQHIDEMVSLGYRIDHRDRYQVILAWPGAP